MEEGDLSGSAVHEARGSVRMEYDLTVVGNPRRIQMWVQKEMRGERQAVARWWKPLRQVET